MVGQTKAVEKKAQKGSAQRSGMMVVQKKVVEKKAQKGSAQRSKTGKNSSCVRVDDHNGLNTTIYSTGFQTAKERGLLYDTVKRYELLGRGGGDGGGAADAGFRKRLNYPRIAESISLEPLPMGFGELTKEEKKKRLIKLCEAFVKENASKIVGQDEVVQGVQDVGPQVDPVGELEFDEGCAAANPGLLMECNNGESSFQGGYPLQDAHWNQQGNPEGRPPTSYDGHADDLLQCVSRYKLRACKHPDIFLLLEALEKQIVDVSQKLRDREISIVDEVLEAERRSPHSRSREMELPAQLVEAISDKDMLMGLDKLPLMEGIRSHASYSGGHDVEHGVKNYVDTMPHVSAVCSLSPLASFSDELPERAIPEALEVAPINMGQLKDMSLPVNYLQDYNEHIAGDYSRTMEQYGGNSPSQFVSAADQWNDPDIITLWSTDNYPNHQQEDLMGMPMLSHGHAT